MKVQFSWRTILLASLLTFSANLAACSDDDEPKQDAVDSQEGDGATEDSTDTGGDADDTEDSAELDDVDGTGDSADTDEGTDDPDASTSTGRCVGTQTMDCGTVVDSSNCDAFADYGCSWRHDGCADDSNDRYDHPYDCASFTTLEDCAGVEPDYDHNHGQFCKWTTENIASGICVLDDRCHNILVSEGETPENVCRAGAAATGGPDRCYAIGECEGGTVDSSPCQQATSEIMCDAISENSPDTCTWQN